MATYRALLSLKSSLDDPDSRLSALRLLNVFNRTFPPELSNLTNLRVLDLYNNYLTGVLPVSVATFHWFLSFFFRNHFFPLLFLSRALPLLPEFSSRPDPDPVTRPDFSGQLRPTQTTAPVGFSFSPSSELTFGGDVRRFGPEVVTRSSKARVRDPVGFLHTATATRRETDRDRRPLASWFDFGWPWSATHDREWRWWIPKFSNEFR
ncbi:hypothetical protein ACLB2K_007772 [Fragaria x ananassa]